MRRLCPRPREQRFESPRRHARVDPLQRGRHRDRRRLAQRRRLIAEHRGEEAGAEGVARTVRVHSRTLGRCEWGHTYPFTGLPPVMNKVQRGLKVKLLHATLAFQAGIHVRLKVVGHPKY